MALFKGGGDRVDGLREQVAKINKASVGRLFVIKLSTEICTTLELIPPNNNTGGAGVAGGSEKINKSVKIYTAG